MEKQTAVQWLMEQMMANEFHNPYFEQALQMEKNQIVDAHGIKTTTGNKQGVNFYTQMTGEQYYNKTYKTQQHGK